MLLLRWSYQQKKERKKLTLSSQTLEALKITGMHANYIHCHKHSILQCIPLLR